MRLLITTADQIGDGQDRGPEDTERYKAWDVITVLPDDHVFGREETMEAWVAAGNRAADFPNGHFTVIDIPNEPPDRNLSDPEPDPGVRAEGRKAAWAIDPSLLTAKQATDALEPGAIVSIARGRRNAVRRKRDNAALPPTISNDGNTPVRPEITTNSRAARGPRP